MRGTQPINTSAQPRRIAIELFFFTLLLGQFRFAFKAFYEPRLGQQQREALAVFRFHWHTNASTSKYNMNALFYIP